MSEIPVDLYPEILKYLPAKGLLRFKCACKSIRYIIDSRDFINVHPKITSDNKTLRKKILFRESMPLSSTFSLFGGEDNNGYIAKFLVYDVEDELLRSFDIDDQFWPQNLPNLNFFAHCNGLVLLGEDLYRLGVWNPTTRKYKKFPPLPDDPDAYSDHRITGLGFGYDSCSDDYKVLLIKEVHTFAEDLMHDFQSEIWILGLRSCYWTKIEKELKYRVTQYERPKIQYIRNCFLDGVFLFIWGPKVLQFDVANETISVVRSLYNGLVWSNFSQVLEGYICIHYANLEGQGERKIGVYVKDEVKRYCATLSFTENQDMFHVLYREGHKVFIVDDRHPFLCIFDLKDRNLQRTELKIKDIDNWSVIFCIESLVSVDYQE